MIHPDKIQEAARKKENENFRFRSYLKKYGKEEEIDRQFLRLHKELFAEIAVRCTGAAFLRRILRRMPDIWGLRQSSLSTFS